jgi:hypothetical protein
MLTAPPLPLVEVAEPIEMEPEEPELEVPVLNASIPLTPAVPPFDERIVIAPLVDATP